MKALLFVLSLAVVGQAYCRPQEKKAAKGVIEVRLKALGETEGAACLILHCSLFAELLWLTSERDA